MTASHPDQKITLVIPIEPGGIIDIIASPFAIQLQQAVDRPVRTEYMPGALTQTGSAYVACAPGDGCTLLAHSRQLVNNRFITEDAVDPTSDLVAVSLLATTPFVLVAHPALPVRTLSDLLDIARTGGRTLTYANSGRASNQQMSVELLKSLTSTEITRREYDGGGGALEAVISGDSDLGIFAQGAIAQPIRDGTVRAIAVTGKEPSSALAGVPTMREAGLPGYEFESWVGLFAPASTPAGILSDLSAHVTAAAQGSAFKALMARQGARAIGSSPADFAQFLQAELALWGGIIGASKI